MLSEQETLKFFARMQHLYGHKWASQYGAALEGDQLSPSAKQWRYDLREYDRDQVSYGLARLLEIRPEWPPGPIEFMNLCDGIPTIAQLMDRDNDYGIVCKAIRARMDWYNLDAMPSRKRRDVGAQQAETAICGLRREGAIHSLAKELVSEHKQQEAIA